MILDLRDLFPHHLLWLATEKISRARTDERVPFLEIHYQNQVGKTFQQPAAKLLLLRQLPLHPAAFGDVHQRTLVADNISRCVPNRPRGISKDRGFPVFAPKFNLARAYSSAIVNRTPQHRWSRLEIQGCRLDCQKVSLLFVSQHAYQRWVRVQQLSLGCAEINALLQGFE